MARWNPPWVAIVGAPPLQAVTLATPLRRAGISTETFFTGNLKKQLGRASDVKVTVVVRGDEMFVRSMRTGKQWPTTPDTLVEDVTRTLTKMGVKDDG